MAAKLQQSFDSRKVFIKIFLTKNLSNKKIVLYICNYINYNY